MESQCI
ncbi:hypothetical protein LEMLEM_LOCUS16959 [Lemmus lemmus]